MTYRQRLLEPVLARRCREFPVVVVTGPRQSGKTTLLRRRFPGCDYASLEAPDVRAAALADPRGFLAARARPVILDEIQHAPELLSYVQEEVDAHRGSRGRFLLSGSQNLLLMERVTQTLAGRASVLTLLSMGLSEQAGVRAPRTAWEGRPPSRVAASHGELWRRIVRGGFPEVALSPKRDADAWLASYRQTYLERDVRRVRQVGDLSQFDSFVRALAARSGSLLDLSGISRDLGIAVNTVKAWLSVLEASWLVTVVRPWAVNAGKRLVKTPKVYFLDTGLLAHLVGLSDPVHAQRGPMAGALFETAVLNELLRAHLHRGRTPRLHFYRTSSGLEVDFLVELAGRLVPFEAKATGTPLPAHAAGIHALRRDLGERLAPGFVVHAGSHVLPLGEGVTALPLGCL